jgi:hypothetical protein
VSELRKFVRNVSVAERKEASLPYDMQTLFLYE